MQGEGLDGYPRYALVLAGAKHFSMFDGPKNGGDAAITDQDWFWNYIPNFEAAVAAGAYVDPVMIRLAGWVGGMLLYSY